MGGHQERRAARLGPDPPLSHTVLALHSKDMCVEQLSKHISQLSTELAPAAACCSPCQVWAGAGRFLMDGSYFLGQRQPAHLSLPR